MKAGIDARDKEGDAWYFGEMSRRMMFRLREQPNNRGAS